MNDATREQTVRALTQMWLDATVRADAAALDGMITEGYTFTHATTAITDTREEWLESFRSGRRRYKLWEISDVTVRLFPSVAIMTGRGHQEIPRDDGMFDLLFTNVGLSATAAGRWSERQYSCLRGALSGISISPPAFADFDLWPAVTFTTATVPSTRQRRSLSIFIARPPAARRRGWRVPTAQRTSRLRRSAAPGVQRPSINESDCSDRRGACLHVSTWYEAPSSCTLKPRGSSSTNTSTSRSSSDIT